jgi:hypothetical protein
VINRRMKMLCFLFSIILMGGVSVHGQEGHTEQGLSSPGKFIITNGSETTTVHFYLRNGDGDWTRFGLGPNQDAEYSNATNIKIVSEGNKVVQYRVVADRRYRIYWRETERYWDIELL